MGVEELLKEKREDILKVAASHGACNIRVFGSVARGEANESSDIDLLVDMEPDRSLLDVAALLADLSSRVNSESVIRKARGMPGNPAPESMYTTVSRGSVFRSSSGPKESST